MRTRFVALLALLAQAGLAGAAPLADARSEADAGPVAVHVEKRGAEDCPARGHDPRCVHCRALAFDAIGTVHAAAPIDSGTSDDSRSFMERTPVSAGERTAHPARAPPRVATRGRNPASLRRP